MPVHLSQISRRQFIRTTLVAGASLTVFRSAWAEPGRGDSHWALLSDPHIAANPKEVSRDVNMTAHLKQAVSEVLALENKPAGVFVNGDCAFALGLPEDYANYKSLIKPFAASGLPVHMTLGNHDHREHFRKSLTADNDKASLVASRHVSMVETGFVNWVLLDSLDEVNSTPGILGKEQRDWLAGALDASGDKPAIVVLHHNPNLDANSKSGIADTAELFAVILPRKRVKALVFGHSHNWNIQQREGLHLVNLPAIAYVFAKNQPSAWVDCNLSANNRAGCLFRPER